MDPEWVRFGLVATWTILVALVVIVLRFSGVGRDAKESKAEAAKAMEAAGAAATAASKVDKRVDRDILPRVYECERVVSVQTERIIAIDAKVDNVEKKVGSIDDKLDRLLMR